MQFIFAYFQNWVKARNIINKTEQKYSLFIQIMHEHKNQKNMGFGKKALEFRYNLYFFGFVGGIMELLSRNKSYSHIF